MSTAVEFKSAQTAEAEARYELADREHTALMGQLMVLDVKHERAWTAWGKERLRARGEALMVGYDASRAEFRAAYHHLLLCRWHDAAEVSRRAWAAVSDAQNAGAPGAEVAALIEAAEAAVDAVAEAARAVEAWRL